MYHLPFYLFFVISVTRLILLGLCASNSSLNSELFLSKFVIIRDTVYIGCNILCKLSGRLCGFCLKFELCNN